jgi:DNA-directed RNA polymerase specialized sigma24 family protein
MDSSVKMYRRLYSLAFKRFGCDHDASHDYATDALCKMLAAKTEDFNFGFTVLQNQIRTDARNRKRRKTYQFPVDEEGEPMELKVAAQFADADLTLIAIECLTAIEALPAGTREVMRLVALEATPDEIVLDRGIPKSEVYWRTQVGRKLLRDRAGYELERKRGHHKFIGIRKDCRKWVASLRKGDDYYHIGYFDTANEAARAYDEKAREIHGAAAKLNFTSEAAE